MSVRAADVHQGDATDQLLARLIEEWTEVLEAGRPIDIEQYLDRYPEHKETLLLLRPAVELLGDLGRSQVNASRPLAQSPDAEPMTGVLGDYRIVREIGRGGMGVVYEAEQISLGRRVALKVLPFAGMMDSRQLARFKTEAQAAAHLEHPNIVGVYGVGCERGVHFYAMRYVEGQSLAALVRQLRAQTGLDHGEESTPDEPDIAIASRVASGRFGPTNGPTEVLQEPATDHTCAAMPDGVAQATADSSPVAVLSKYGSTTDLEYFHSIARLGKQAADALDHAHEHGIVHRDIKPGNLLLDEAGKVWVTDFGLARIEADPGLTMTGDVLGTLRYMAPEQALAKRGVVDQRTDVYALGATLYELFGLQPVLSGCDRQELLSQLAFKEPRRLRRINPSIPVDLETIVQKAIAKEPVDRYATAGELADDLGRFLEHQPIQAKKPSLLVRTKMWSRRHKTVITTAVLAVLFAWAVSSFLIWYQRTEAIRQRDIASDQRQQAVKNLQLARESLEDTFALILDNDLRADSGNPREVILIQLLKFYELLMQLTETQRAIQQGANRVDHRERDIQNKLGQSDTVEDDYRKALVSFEKLRAAIASRNGPPQDGPRPNALKDSRLKDDSRGIVPTAGVVSIPPGGNKLLQDGQQSNGPHLVSTTFRAGSFAEKRFPNALDLAISSGRLYVSGAEAEVVGAHAFVVCYDLPTGASSDPVYRWEAPWSTRGFSGAGSESFTGVTVSNEGVFAAGASYHETTDAVRGKECKSVLVKFGLDGATGSDVDGADWVARPHFFSYDGLETFRDLAISTKAGRSFLYVAGRAATSGDGNVVSVVSKYDTAGRLLAKASESDTGFRGELQLGYGTANGLSVLNGQVYVVGKSRLTGLGEDNSMRPYLARLDADLNQVWRQRDSTVEGGFNSVTGFDRAIYTVGSTERSGVVSSRDFLIERYNENSTRRWSADFGGPNADELTDVVVIGGRLFAVGSTKSEGAGGEDAVILEIDPDNGEVLSKTLFGGPEDDRASGVATDGSDLYVVGTSRSFDTEGGNAAGQSHLMLLHYVIPETAAAASKAETDEPTTNSP